jgi:TetR/AcrR family transcriptional regulator
MPAKQRVSLRDFEQEAEKFSAPKTEKERAIIMAAAALIGERGINGATTAEIARRANVTEKTLFRYFPSKKDLVRRVMFPLLLENGLARQWGILEQVFKEQKVNLKDWFIAASSKELSMVRRHGGLANVAMIEMMQDEELLGAVTKLWLRHVWRPMLESLEELKRSGMIRKDVDLEVLGRAMHCLHVGYFITSTVFAPGRRWNDEIEVEKMADLLARGAGTRS